MRVPFVAFVAFPRVGLVLAGLGPWPGTLAPFLHGRVSFPRPPRANHETPSAHNQGIGADFMHELSCVPLPPIAAASTPEMGPWV